MADEQKVIPEKSAGTNSKHEAQEFSTEKAEDKILEKEKEQASEISGAEKDDAYAKILSKVKNDDEEDKSKSEEVKFDAKNTSEKMDAESQIQNLVDIAMNKGVAHSVRVARHLEDNYVLDMFHDKLLGSELHNALVEKGLIKDI